MAVARAADKSLGAVRERPPECDRFDGGSPSESLDIILSYVAHSVLPRSSRHHQLQIRGGASEPRTTAGLDVFVCAISWRFARGERLQMGAL